LLSKPSRGFDHFNSAAPFEIHISSSISRGFDSSSGRSKRGWSFTPSSIAECSSRHDVAQSYLRRLRERGVSCVALTPEQFRAISLAPHASGIGAIVKQHITPIAAAQPYRGLCWIVIEAIRSGGNLGTILRTAEAAGAAGVAFLGRDCDPFDPAVVRASMGGLFHLQLVRASHERFARWARGLGINLVGLAPGASTLWIELPVGPIAIAVGEERGGLSAPLTRMCNTLLRLPMTGRADSLNVSVATGVMLYELIRQRMPLSAAPA
jgi:TrmH family RNA methyltransferase